MTTTIPGFKPAQEVINSILQNEVSAIEKEISKNSFYETSILYADVIDLLKKKGYDIALIKKGILYYYRVTPKQV